MMAGGGTPSAPKGQTLLHPQAPQQQDGEEHNDRDKRLAIYRGLMPKEEAPHGGAGLLGFHWGGTWFREGNP